MTGFARAEAGLEAQPSVSPAALNGAEVAAPTGRVAVFNRDLWAMRGRIAAATGLTPVPALVSAVGCEAVAVWGAGRSWTAAAACGAGARMIHLEDAFLRSPSPGRGAESVGLIVDPVGPDPARSPRLARLIDERAALPDQTDGAAALVLMRRSEAERRGLTIRAVIRGHASYAAKPGDFPTAPVPPMKSLMERLSWSHDDIDLWEVNEAFAVVPMAAEAMLGIPREKLNVNGGACALGHPIGASGARILVTLLHALEHRGGKKGMAGICIGGGEGTAVALELP